MFSGVAFRDLSRGARLGLVAGIVLLLGALGGRSWLLGFAGVGVLAGVAWSAYSVSRADPSPWPWPADFRALAEALARPIDPTPERILPPDERTLAVAQVATDAQGLARLIANKPPAWPWAVFTSVLVQRRNAVQSRLRAVVSGYQPRPGLLPVTSQAYAAEVYQVANTLLDLVGQLEQFMLSPAFKAALGDASNGERADAEAITGIANRLMDYHDAMLSQAEVCVQTPVETDALMFVQDAGAFALHPLIGYQRFITTMCARIGEAQDLLPHTNGGGVLGLDDANLEIDMSDDLSGRVFAHIRRFQT